MNKEEKTQIFVKKNSKYGGKTQVFPSKLNTGQPPAAKWCPTTVEKKPGVYPPPTRYCLVTPTQLKPSCYGKE